MVRLATVYAQATANAGSEERMELFDGEKAVWMRLRIMSGASSPAATNSFNPGTNVLEGCTDVPGVAGEAAARNCVDGVIQRNTTSKLEEVGNCSVVHCALHTPSSPTFIMSLAGTGIAVIFNPTPLTT